MDKINIVENALITGLMPVFKLENINIVIVVDPGPLKKLAIIKSSNDNANIKIQQYTIAGIITGRYILNNILVLPIPKSLAASSRV